MEGVIISKSSILSILIKKLVATVKYWVIKYPKYPEIVKWQSNEVQEAVESRAALVQFHALGLLHQVCFQNYLFSLSYLFQALWLPCLHAIAACTFYNLNYDDFVDLLYKLENIFKVYQHRFHSLESEDTWPQYLGPHFMFDPSKWRQILDRSAPTRIHNEMDKPIPNRPKKCSLCRSEWHNRINCLHKQVHN